MTVSKLRINASDGRKPLAGGLYVLYWMTVNRRAFWNAALERAVEWSRELRKPLIVFESLACDGEWDNDRHGSFLLNGMRDNAREFAKRGVAYFPCVEPKAGAGANLLRDLCGKACVVVADKSPYFDMGRRDREMLREAKCAIEMVDSCGIIPLSACPRQYLTAASFRRECQRHLLTAIHEFPEPDPLRRYVFSGSHPIPMPEACRWSLDGLTGDPAGFLASREVDHSVAACELPGGSAAGRNALKRFLKSGLARYSSEHNHPDCEATSGLSPYLCAGHISSCQVLADLLRHEDWSLARVSLKPTGARSGWWGLNQDAEAFLDQLITWRELGYNTCHFSPGYASYQSLPDWAKATLADHSRDPRQYLYSREQLRDAETHDPVWNAAQRQLLREGVIHNYLRMLWGKNILAWSSSPEEALRTMLDLNNRYALDAPDPNSYSGIFWCLGRFDRPWGPERLVFGKIRFMRSECTRKKLKMLQYLRNFA